MGDNNNSSERDFVWSESSGEAYVPAICNDDKKLSMYSVLFLKFWN